MPTTSNNASSSDTSAADYDSADFDSPWKEALESRFAEFLALLFPQIYREVDWQRPPEFLDKELQKIVRDADVGRRYADKLVKVWTRDAREVWVLIHVEVQGDSDPDFAKRMFVYNYRIFDWRQVDVVSLGVLADTTQSFRPTAYHQERWGCELDFRFPVVKLMDWEARWDELEASDNVFALVVMAQIKAKTSRDAIEMRDWKLHLVRLLYQRGYSKAIILELFNIIDWMITLPEELTRQFREAVTKMEEEGKMPYINSIERLAKKEGRVEERFNTIRTVVHSAKNKGLSEKLISEITNLDINIVSRVLNNEPIEMIGHLLLQDADPSKPSEVRA